MPNHDIMWENIPIFVTKRLSLWKESYYTIHPSLVFRHNSGYKYPDRIYMCDAFFQKYVLCNWNKLIWNIDDILTIHRVKKWASNYTYKRFNFNKETISTIFTLHPFFYWGCVVMFELMRKLIYPVLHKTKKTSIIDIIERMPFVLMGYKIKNVDDELNEVRKSLNNLQ